MVFSMCFGADDEDKKASEKIDKQIQTWYKEHKYAVKVLLLGAGEAGKTTVLKQMKILHIQGFTDEERLERAVQIKKNVHEAAGELSRQLKPLGLEPGPAAREAADAIIEMGTTPPPFTQEYFDIVVTLWADPAVKECLRRSNEYQLIDSAEYFLNRLDSVRQPDYIPEDKDILQCRQKTTGIQKIRFNVKIPSSMQGGTQDFWLFDVGGQRGERKKWIQVFEGIHAVWFLVASSDFDQTLREDQSHNRLLESVTLFEDVWKSRFLVEAGLIVFLNKQDILEKKIREGRSIAKYFPEYISYKTTQKNLPADEYQCTRMFIKNLLVQVTQKRSQSGRVTGRNQEAFRLENSRPRECYYHFTVATNTDNIRTVFNDVHHLILTKTLKDLGMM